MAKWKPKERSRICSMPARRCVISGRERWINWGLFNCGLRIDIREPLLPTVREQGLSHNTLCGYHIIPDIRSHEMAPTCLASDNYDHYSTGSRTAEEGRYIACHDHTSHRRSIPH